MVREINIREYERKASDDWEKVVQYVKKNEAELRAKYDSDYIAISREGVIDHDSNEDALRKRALPRKQDITKFIFINNIEGILNPPIFECGLVEIV